MPIPALAAVNQQAPTAELRPPTRSQTDEDDLMPYDVLDAIERAAIRDKHSPLEVFSHYARPVSAIHACNNSACGWSDSSGSGAATSGSANAMPPFHLDDENLDPKTWCRWPILSGGFELELAELRKQVADGKC